MAEIIRNSDVKSASPALRGPLLAAVASLVLVVACLMDCADVHVVVFSRSYTGVHFGEGRLTLGLAVAGAVLAAAAVLWFSRLAYFLPLVASGALALTRKYHEVGRAFSSVHGFRLADASVGNGLLVAIVASAAPLAVSLYAVADCLRLEPITSRTASEVR